MLKVLVVTSASLLAMNSTAFAEQPSGLDIAQQISNRNDGDARIGTMSLILKDAKGNTRTRIAKSFLVTQDTHTKIAIYFTKPRNISGTAFTSVDYDEESRQDKQWLYLPVTSRVRAIPSSDRGDSFIGTDFSYDDVKSNLKFGIGDYRFNYVELRETDDGPRHVISGIPVSDKIAKSLGYSSMIAIVDPHSWFVDKVDFKGTDGKPLKTIKVEKKEKIDGVWTATSIHALNHKTGHSTTFNLNDVAYVQSLPDEVFESDALEYGVPEDY